MTIHDGDFGRVRSVFEFFFFLRAIRSFVRTREGRVSYARRDRWTTGGYDPGTIPSYRCVCVCVCIERGEGGEHTWGAIYHKLLSSYPYNPYRAYFELLNIHPYPPPLRAADKTLNSTDRQGRVVLEPGNPVFVFFTSWNAAILNVFLTWSAYAFLFRHVKRHIPVAYWGREWMDGGRRNSENINLFKHDFKRLNTTYSIKCK